MLAIRMQRTGRKGLPHYRVIVQDSHRSPSSGRVVSNLGSYNPHTKELSLNKEKAQTYLNNGAQPSDRVIALLKKEGVKLPSWVKEVAKNERSTRNPEKLRKNQPAEEATPEEPVAEAPAEAEETPAEAPSEEKTEE